MITATILPKLTEADIEYLLRESVEDDGETLAEMCTAFRIVARDLRPSPERIDDLFRILETAARKRWAATRKDGTA